MRTATYTPYGSAGDLGYLEALEESGALDEGALQDLKMMREVLRDWGMLEVYRASPLYAMGRDLAQSRSGE